MSVTQGGSVIDTQRIAEISLTERRDSLDSRWWKSSSSASDRRDSTSSSVLSSSSASAGAGHQSPRTSRVGTGAAPSSFATFSWATPPVVKTEQNAMQQPPGHDQNGSSQRSTFEQQPIDIVNMMPPMSGIVQDRRVIDPHPDSSSSASPNNQSRVLRSRSRPPSRQMVNDGLVHHDQQQLPGPPPFQPGGEVMQQDDKGNHTDSQTPYSRSPELRVSHKLAERKRRREMKDLFDDLRESLPADRGMKASKWEILSKCTSLHYLLLIPLNAHALASAIEFINQLKQNHQEMAREIDLLRHELEVVRGGAPPMSAFPPGGPQGPHVVYSQHPGLPPGYAMPGAPISTQQPPPGVAQPPHLQPNQQQPGQHPIISRPSSQNTFAGPPPGGPSAPMPWSSGRYVVPQNKAFRQYLV